MKILVTAGTSLIGKYLLRQIKGHVEVTATYCKNTRFYREKGVKYSYLNVTAQDSVEGIFKAEQPDVVVHIASIGSVDYSESHRQEARLVNIGGTKNVVKVALRAGARFIFISSNAVFDGKSAPYKEEDPPMPVNYYGELKLEGEKIVAASGLEYAIVRPILIYGWNEHGGRTNPVTWLLPKLGERRPIKIVDDIYCNPLSADNCAEALWAVIYKEKTGIYHMGGRDRVSRFDFAVKIAKAFGLEYRLIEPVPSSYFSNMAPRPKDTTYITEKMEQDLGVKPLSIDEGLEMMILQKGAYFVKDNYSNTRI